MDYNEISFERAIKKKNYFLLSFLLKNTRQTMDDVNYMTTIKHGNAYTIQINKIDSRKDTGLHYAVRARDIHAVKMVLDARVVDKTIRNDKGETAEDIAINNGDFEIVNLIRRY